MGSVESVSHYNFNRLIFAHENLVIIIICNNVNLLLLLLTVTVNLHTFYSQKDFKNIKYIG